MSLENVLKVARKFEKFIKNAQETVQGDNDLVVTVNKAFSQKEKNAIANEIANHPSIDELNSLNISLTGNGSAIAITALVNGSDNATVKQIISKALAAKKIPQNTKGNYTNWIKYPA